MFKKLRRGFIRMNMLVISLIMLVSFAVVCMLAYTSIQNEIRDELRMLLAMARNAPPEGEGAFGQENPPHEVQPAEGMEPGGPVPRLGFVVYLEEDGYALAQARPFFNMNELDIPAMLAAVEESGSTSGNFTLEEHRWTYRTVTEAYGEEKVAFVETSESRAILMTLVRIFLLVAVLLLGVIWRVSWWFAKRSTAPIEEAYNNQRRFVQDASHELKTPVAVLKTNLELLRSHPDDSVASQREWLDNMASETAHMEHLKGRLLVLARADTDTAGAPGRCWFFQTPCKTASCPWRRCCMSGTCALCPTCMRMCGCWATAGNWSASYAF